MILTNIQKLLTLVRKSNKEEIKIYPDTEYLEFDEDIFYIKKENQPKLF
jgi:hypothetical protein